MRRLTRRRAFTLMELLLILPVIAAMSAVAFEIAGRTLRAEGRGRALLMEEAVMRDLVRRIQEDAGRAGEATVEQDDAGVSLRLANAGRVVVYQVADGQVTRNEQTGASPAAHYAWRLGRARLDVSVEAVGSGPGVVWASFSASRPVDRGPMPEWRLSAAAAVGGGGGS